jgi:hypothetical protein
VATSAGVVKRPVAKPPILAMTVSRAVSASIPVAFATVSATPCSPTQSSVLTGPGETALTRTPRGPNSWASDLVRVTSAAFGRPVVDRAGIRLTERVDGRHVHDRSRTPLEHGGPGKSSFNDPGESEATAGTGRNVIPPAILEQRR